MNKKIFLGIALLALPLSSSFAGEVTGTVDTGGGGTTTAPSGTIMASPVASPVAGTYTSTQSITLSAEGAPYICYTVDGTTPTCDWSALSCATGTKYTSALSVTSSTTVNAISCYQASETSSVSSFAYTISTSSGGGGGGGGGGSSASFAARPYALPQSTSSTPQTLTDRSIQLPKDGENAGVFTRPIEFKDSKSGISASFEEGAKATNEDGTPFVGELSPAKRILESKLPKSLPRGEKMVIAFSIGAETKIFFDKKVRVAIPLEEKLESIDDIYLYFFRESDETYEKITGFTLSEDGMSIVFETDHFTTFVISQEDSGEANWTNESETGLVLDSEATEPLGDSIFVDIRGHWGQPFVQALLAKQALTPKTLFYPNNFVTRAEAIKITLILKGSAIPQAAEAPFPDVSPDAWYSPFVAVALAEGIVNGVSGGNFAPNNPMTRAESLKVLAKASGAETAEYKGKTFFTDVPDDSWQSEFVSWAKENGIVSGFSDGTFAPNRPVTRAEFSKMAALAFGL